MTAATGVAPISRRAAPPRAHWWILALVLGLEFGLFTQHVRREVAWAFPTYADQAAYLRRTYDTYEAMLANGFGPGMLYGIGLPAPQGALIHLEGALAFLLLGRSRWAALCVNFAHYALFQCVLAAFVAWRSRSSAAALVAVGMLLAVSTPFYPAGGLLDFRLDFIAWNIYGIFICAVLRSCGFASLRWSIVAGGVAAWLGIFRFIAAPYLCGVFALTAVALGTVLLSRSRHLQLTPRVRGLLCAATVFAAIAGPVLWWKREPIRMYYLVAQAGEQAYRKFGVASRIDNLTFYPASAFSVHGGWPFVWAGFTAVVVCAFLAWRWGRPAPRRLRWDGAGFFLVACALSPYAILTTSPAKSPVVGHVLVLPLLFAFVLPVAHLVRRLPGNGPSPWLLRGLAAVILAAGLVKQAGALGVHGPLQGQRPDVEEVHRLHDTLFAYSQLAGWNSMKLSVDFVSETVTTATVGLYERHGVSLPTTLLLGNRVRGIDRSAALAFLRESDFVVLTEHDERTSYNHPLDESGRDLAPALQQFVRARMFPLGEFHIFDRHLVLYARPGLVTEGNEGGWITRDGFTIQAPGAALRVHPHLRLWGRSPMAYLGGRLPGVRATLTVRGRPPLELPAHIANAQDAYCIGVDVPPEVSPTLPALEAARIDLAFDRDFVPREIGINEDPRHLVLTTPETVQLSRSPARCTPESVADELPWP